jgi:transposase InsO family protein
VNHKKTQRLWREEGLRVPQRRRRKRCGAFTSDAPTAALYPGHVWAIDFQADHLEDGTGFKIASIIDEHTRQVLDDTVDVSITGEDVVDILERLALTHGMPKVSRMDNGLELTCRALAPRIQPRATALQPGLQDPDRIRCALHLQQTRLTPHQAGPKPGGRPLALLATAIHSNTAGVMSDLLDRDTNQPQRTHLPLDPDSHLQSTMQV